MSAHDMFMFVFVSELGSCIAVIVTKIMGKYIIRLLLLCKALHQMHMIILLIFEYQKDPGNSCALLSTSRFDLLHGTFAVFLCQTPLIRTVLKRAPPSLPPCLPSHLAKPNKTGKRLAEHIAQARRRSPRACEGFGLRQDMKG